MVPDDADAMRIANDRRYGLGGGTFSRNPDNAMKLARDRFDTGTIRINSFAVADPNTPSARAKNSSFGREHDGFGMK